MDSHASSVFSTALEGCQKLQQVFPTDDRLRSIVGQLEQWKSLIEKPKEGNRKDNVIRFRRVDPRYIRPIDEDVACLVHDAVAEATRLGLA